MMPHLAETCWEALGHSTLIANAHWPVADQRLVQSDTVTIAVQVNGKRRGEIEIARDADEETGQRFGAGRGCRAAGARRQDAAPRHRGARPHRQRGGMMISERSRYCSSCGCRIGAFRVRVSSAVRKCRAERRVGPTLANVYVEPYSERVGYDPAQ
jgi:hypothetical protein